MKRGVRNETDTSIPAAHRFVDADPGGGSAGAAEDDVILGVEGDPFGVEDSEEVSGTVLIALACQRRSFSGTGGAGFEVTEALALAVVAREGVFDFFESKEHRLLIGRERGIGSMTDGFDLLSHTSEIQEGPTNARTKAISIRAVLAEACEALAFEVETSAEGDAGKQVGGSDADSGCGSGEVVFSHADVGAQAEQIGGFGNGDAGGYSGLFESFLELCAQF
jgi:hypothetical protein